jgi:uncharacterized membrane protein (UPF0127 family)
VSLKILRKSDYAAVVQHGKVADDFLSRLKGLIGVKKFTPGDGLLFPKNNSVHMWMMSIPIDVVFLKNNRKDQTWTIVKLHSAAKPWSLIPMLSTQADDTLELPQGTIDRLNLKLGEVLCIAS